MNKKHKKNESFLKSWLNPSDEDAQIGKIILVVFLICFLVYIVAMVLGMAMEA